jgi:phage shock protein A
MADIIASRVARIVSGSVRALLDAVEGATRENRMAQAMREVDQAIDEVRTELGRGEAAKHLVTTQLNKLNADNDHLTEQIELALRQHREDLARMSVEKQINIEDQVPVLQRSLAEHIERGKELEGYIAALLAKRREMEHALQELITSSASDSSPGEVPTESGAVRRADRAGLAFDRAMARQRRSNGLQSRVTADAAKLQELQELQRNERIEERLARLKASRQPQ